ncbi:nucleoredoxin-like protein 2 isoform X2 [Trachypithecus francoisi]|uniref:nucleoredoxin-like protein 2 isoform X2 n=1 Tax=Trachypithecus francoisi TaxID=54180 RepID=UPI00141BBE54|nr:nucleoredoxin-like protein 2 isoform X2 [Trachypithecus francoisi]
MCAWRSGARVRRPEGLRLPGWLGSQRRVPRCRPGIWRLRCLSVSLSALTLLPQPQARPARGVGASRAGLEKSSARRCGQWRGTAALATSFPQVIILLQVSSGLRWLRVRAMVDILGGRHLLTRKGAAVEAEAALQNKVVALYFAAARCGPSRDFTQLLCDFYTALVAEARRPAPFEVVFVSADDSSQEMLNFMRELHGTWLALPFHDPYRHELRKRYNVTATPKLVIVKQNGEVITNKGRKQIRERGLACFQDWVEAADIFQNFCG